MQTDATLLANNTEHCRPQHVASVCMELQKCWHLLALVSYSLKPVKLFGPCKRTQQCLPKTPNNTQQYCDLLRPFAWALKFCNTIYCITTITIQHNFTQDTYNAMQYITLHYITILFSSSLPQSLSSVVFCIPLYYELSAVLPSSGEFT